jgi:hypothetical protein
MGLSVLQNARLAPLDQAPAPLAGDNIFLLSTSRRRVIHIVIGVNIISVIPLSRTIELTVIAIFTVRHINYHNLLLDMLKISAFY